ncbi:DMT family transporter [Microvirga sp. 2YAF29]|uniref:DMT family transporter n=1 Tax=Microvirga sp. 2YAF29 TaxID=3233031 RepID=UPI003F99C303
MKPLLGISLKIVSALFFTMMSATLKILTARYPTGEVMFFRASFAMIPLLMWLAWRGDLPRALHTENAFGHFKRGILGSASMFCGFAALFYLPLHDAIAIGYASPLMVVILAAILLKEQVRIYRWSAVAIGLVGVLIMLSPYLSLGSFSAGLQSGPTLGALLCLTGATLSAGAMIQVRRLTATERTGAIVFYFTITSSGLALLSLPFGWAMPTWPDLALFMLAGLFGGIGQILVTECYRWADTSVIAPFEYTTMIWALLLGWIVFCDLPTSTVVTGAGIVAMTGLFIVWREHRLGLMRKRELQAAPQKPV